MLILKRKFTKITLVIIDKKQLSFY